jgi:hypothetical protein
MPMTVETESRQRCPVCDGNVERGSPRCVRCESDLEMWWPLEAAIRTIDEPLAAAIEHRQAPVHGLAHYVPIVIVAALCGIAIGSAAYRAITRVSASAGTVSQAGITTPAPNAVADSRVPTNPSAPAAQSGVVIYYVQRGDTWWRLAASFTGRGANWRALEAAANHVPLRAGSVLLLDRAALSDSVTSPR